jgi:hypothetical protein
VHAGHVREARPRPTPPQLAFALEIEWRHAVCDAVGFPFSIAFNFQYKVYVFSQAERLSSQPGPRLKYKLEDTRLITLHCH